MQLFDPPYLTVWYAFAAALLVAFLLTPLIRRVALGLGAVASTDKRRIHQVPTPQWGGIGILIAMLGAALYFVPWEVRHGMAQLNQLQLMTTLVCAVAICALGAADDALDLSWRPKLLGQFAVAAIVVLLPAFFRPEGIALSQTPLIINMIDLPLIAPIEIPSVIGMGVVIVWIVAVMNMMNFIDGVDGLAAGQAALIAATFAVIAASYSRIGVAVIAAATCGAALGFLPHNWRKGGARIFMGDSGALLLGFILAVISVQGVLKTTAAISLVIPFALLAVPIFDTTFVVLKRMKHGVSVANPDRWHLHHRLLNVGLSPRRVAAILWAWTASMSAVALALRFVDYGNSNDWNKDGLFIVGFVVLGALTITILLAVQLEIIKSKSVRERNRRKLEQINR